MRWLGCQAAGKPRTSACSAHALPCGRAQPAHASSVAPFPHPIHLPGYSKHDLSSTANTRLGTPVYMAPEVSPAQLLRSGEHRLLRPHAGAEVLHSNTHTPPLPPPPPRLNRRHHHHHCHHHHTATSTGAAATTTTAAQPHLPPTPHPPPTCQVIFINSKYDAKKADVWSCGEEDYLVLLLGQGRLLLLVLAGGPAAAATALRPSIWSAASTVSLR